MQPARKESKVEPFLQATLPDGIGTQASPHRDGDFSWEQIKGLKRRLHVDRGESLPPRM